MLGIPCSHEMIKRSMRGIQNRTSRVVRTRIIKQEGKLYIVKGTQLVDFEPHYKVGETYFIKEKFYIIKVADAEQIIYISDGDKLAEGYTWIPGRFMKEEYARYTITITKTDIKKMNQMTASDYQEEGIRETGNYNIMMQIFHERWRKVNKNKKYDPHKNPYVVGYYYNFKKINGCK